MAHHHVCQRLRRGVLCCHVADVLALAEHRHPVGYIHDLMELVGNDDHGLAVGLHVPHDFKETVGLLGSQDGGGLIQNQDVGAAVEHLDDLHSLLFGDGHIVDLLVGVDLEAVFFADAVDFGCSGFQVQLAFFFQTQDDVLSSGEHIHQLEVLMDHADAVIKGVLGRGDGDGLAVHQDLTFVREVDAGQHVHQRGLAAAVFSQQRQDLTTVDVQRNTVVGNDFSEPLCNVPQLDCCNSFHEDHPSCRFGIKWGSAGETESPALGAGEWSPVPDGISKVDI